MDKDDPLERAVAQILPEKQQLQELISKKKIKVYLGIDPTGPKLHLGHTIPLKKLQQFADLGHEAILVIGTGTVLAGDPSQRSEARKPISTEQIKENIKDWKRQAEKVLNFSKVKIVQNGDWILALTIPKLIEIESCLSATQLFKRDMFQKRLEKGDFVGYQETLYPVLQGYDSVVLDVDAEIGGTDQTFNMLIGRELQKKINNRDKFVITTPLISGTDGKQMTKSTGNCIWLDDKPTDMFGKIMSMSDSQIEEYWNNLTDLPTRDLTELKPLDAKKKLAWEIVRIYHSQQNATDAQQSFEKTFQGGQAPQDIQEIEVAKNAIIVDVVTAQIGSKSEAKRLLEQGAVEVDGQVQKDPKTTIGAGQMIKIGKKIFVKIAK